MIGNVMVKSFAISALAGLALGSAAISDAQTVTLTPIQVPTDLNWGGYELRGGGSVTGLNDVGQFVGMFGEQNWVIWGVPHAYIYNFQNGNPAYGIGSYSRTSSLVGGQQFRLGQLGGSIRPDPNFRYLDVAPATGSDFNSRTFYPSAINNSGVVVGRFSDWGSQDVPVIFDINNLTLSILSVPNAIFASATDINSSGKVVGRFYDGSRYFGFTYFNGIFTTIDAPWSDFTTVSGMNDRGDVIGHTGWGNAFIWNAGSFERFSITPHFEPADINNRRQIVGTMGSPGNRRATLLEDGAYHVFGPQGTWGNTINNLGMIGGEFTNGGFLVRSSSITGAAVPEPASWAMLIAGFGLTGAAMRRRVLAA
jgi:hypothetical protein